MAIKVIGIQHVNVRLNNPEENREFYGRILGLSADPKLPFRPESPNYWWQVGDAQIHTPSSGNGGTGHHFALMVEDIEEAKRVFEAEGVRILRENKAPGRARQLFVEDPAGNQIEFFQPPVWQDAG
jgi:catechol 2,3-dioxygenase-like lactoylglutathione lyase family enzyme